MNFNSFALAVMTLILVGCNSENGHGYIPVAGDPIEEVDPITINNFPMVINSFAEYSIPYSLDHTTYLGSLNSLVVESGGIEVNANIDISLTSSEITIKTGELFNDIIPSFQVVASSESSLGEARKVFNSVLLSSTPSSPAVIDEIQFLLTNIVLTKIELANSSLYGFYKELAYLTENPRWSELDTIETQDSLNQQNLIDIVNSTSLDLYDGFELAKTAGFSFSELLELKEATQLSLDVLFDDTVGRVNDLQSRFLIDVAPAIPLIDIQLEGDDYHLFKGNAQLGYWSGTNWVYSEPFTFLNEL